MRHRPRPATVASTALKTYNTAITVAAPAKVNLYLHVTGCRDDGYHLLDTLVVFPGLGDIITVAPAGQVTLATEGRFANEIPEGPDNLVLKAARLLSDKYDVTEGAKITLQKDLPVASGIGGGSADAAAALKALSALWHLNLSEERLAELGLSLGADIPMCLGSKALFVGGIGEDLANAPKMPKAGILLANPLKPLSTPTVFKERSGPFTPANRFNTEIRDVEHLAGLLSTRTNDLAATARRVEPQVGQVLDVLFNFPNALLTRMSGSGGTCFSLFKDIDTAEQVASSLQESHPDWWVKAAPLEFDPQFPFS
jgi:4-diphosphocytidyl-2-C-methyl-D-erythritol kinase